MTQAPIKKEFLRDIAVAEYCLEEFKKELQRVDTYDPRYRRTRASRLAALRKELHKILMEIEKEYGGGLYDGDKVQEWIK